MHPLIEKRIELGYARRKEAWRDRHFFHHPSLQPGFISLNTNDYLSLTGHPEIVEAHCQALRETSNPTLMSAAFLTESSDQRTFEREMAAFMGTEDAILCQSGWEANVGLITSIADISTPVYIDQIAHMSLWVGGWDSQAAVHRFKHNDLEHLNEQINLTGPGIILVDSIYSTNGSVCPLKELDALADQRSCVLLVDESHSLGLYGPLGEGLCFELGVRPHFITASLSKAFAARGGIIGCSGRFVEYFRLESRPAIFSSAVNSYEARAFSKTLEVVRGADCRRWRLHENAKVLRQGLSGAGYELEPSEAPIIALEAGVEYNTLRLRDALADRGVLGAPFIAPATSKKRSLVRLTVTSALTRPELERTIAACRDARKALVL